MLLYLLCSTDCPVCQAKTEGLVRYPTTLAPASGSVTVTTQCADNATIVNSTTLNVTCTSNGSWSGVTLVCECDDRYHEVYVNATEMCRGKQKSITFLVEKHYELSNNVFL